MATIRVVNCVFHGSLDKPIDLTAIQSELPLKGQLKSKYNRCRPHMLSIRFENKTSLILFPTGRFRIMGGQFQTVETALRWFNQLGKWTLTVNPGLCLQTCTTNFKVDAECVNLVLQRYPDAIFYEPELFTAIKIKRWSDVHVNLFFTGNVVVLGRNAYQRACEVQHWLQDIHLDYILGL